MLKSLVLLPLLSSVALAQAPSSTLIPPGIDKPCADFLNTLNTDTSISKCTQAIIGATSAFAPHGGSPKNASKTDVQTALNAVCSSGTNDPCSTDLFGGKLAAFHAACASALTSSQPVQRLYDVVYSIIPLKNAMCASSDSGSLCSIEANLPQGANAASLQTTLFSPASPNSAVFVPNVEAFSTNDIPFLFLQPSNPSSTMCTSCTRKIINSYLRFEETVPYSLGLSKSLLLSRQQDLYKAIQDTCGSNFLSDVGVQAAGGLAGGTLSGGAVPVHRLSQGLVAFGMGVLAVVASSML